MYVDFSSDPREIQGTPKGEEIELFEAADHIKIMRVSRQIRDSV